ncbi:MAG: hypothetical protein MK212_21715 [Saprospiraceae bacterium]|nr:hypothetical protein [Saprospiraceae bacterium]
MKTLVYLSMIGILALACENDPSNNHTPELETVNLKPYYYPLDSLQDGWVYEYADQASKIVTHYWFFKVVKDEAGDRYLVAVRYNGFFEQDQISREWIVANGTISKDYKILVRDSLTGIAEAYTADISENVVFPFEAVKDTNLAYRFECSFSLPPDTNIINKLTRDRKFREFSTYNLHGDEVDVAVFQNKDFYDIEDVANGGFWTVEKEVTEIYAKGIGLVYQAEKTIDKTNPIPPREIFLSNIYTMEEFIKLKEQLSNAEEQG